MYGDPGGIRTLDLDLERVACWASAPQGRVRVSLAPRSRGAAQTLRPATAPSPAHGRLGLGIRRDHGPDHEQAGEYKKKPTEPLDPPHGIPPGQHASLA